MTAERIIDLTQQEGVGVVLALAVLVVMVIPFMRSAVRRSEKSDQLILQLAARIGESNGKGGLADQVRRIDENVAELRSDVDALAQEHRTCRRHVMAMLAQGGTESALRAASLSQRDEAVPHLRMPSGDGP